MRDVLGEFHTMYNNLIKNKDENVFFNYMRMSYSSYEELKELMLPHIRPNGTNFRTAISGEEKLVFVGSCSLTFITFIKIILLSLLASCPFG